MDLKGTSDDENKSTTPTNPVGSSTPPGVPTGAPTFNTPSSDPVVSTEFQPPVAPSTPDTPVAPMPEPSNTTGVDVTAAPLDGTGVPPVAPTVSSPDNSPAATASFTDSSSSLDASAPTPSTVDTSSNLTPNSGTDTSSDFTAVASPSSDSVAPTDPLTSPSYIGSPVTGTNDASAEPVSSTSSFPSSDSVPSSSSFDSTPSTPDSSASSSVPNDTSFGSPVPSSPATPPTGIDAAPFPAATMPDSTAPPASVSAPATDQHHGHQFSMPGASHGTPTALYIAAGVVALLIVVVLALILL